MLRPLNAIRFRPLRLLPALAVVGIGVQATVATPAHFTMTSANSVAVPSLGGENVGALFAGENVGVVATETATLSGCNNVYITRDFVMWRRITPATPRECSGYSWTSASFVSSTDGWLLGRDGGNTTTILLHTTDGGYHWSSEPGGSTGSNFGYESINFASPGLGWRQQFAIGSNGAYSSEETNDGGSRWTDIPLPATHDGCEFWSDTFVSRTEAFAGPLSDTSNLGFPLAPWLLVTRDGGRHWSKIRVRVPDAPRNARTFYEMPTFLRGGVGVLPVLVATSSSTEIAFFKSDDAGTKWQFMGGLKQPLELSLYDASSTGGISTNACGSVAFGDTLPDISIVNPSDWWVLSSSLRSIFVSNDGGINWRHHALNGIPPSSKVSGTSLYAASGQVAFLSVWTPDSDFTLETRTGGANWEDLTLRSGRASGTHHFS